jgi:hypothetical protein
MGNKNYHWKESDLSPENQRDIPLYWNWMYSNEMKFINHELGKHGLFWDPESADWNLAPKALSDAISKADLSSLDGKLNAYLQVTMAWSKSNNLFAALSAKGILPKSEPVSTMAIVSAFEDYFGAKGFVFPVCIPRKPKKHYFSEIRFCLDANYQVTSCGGKVVENHVNSCTQNVLYPEFPTLGDKVKGVEKDFAEDL